MKPLKEQLHEVDVEIKKHYDEIRRLGYHKDVVIKEYEKYERRQLSKKFSFLVNKLRYILLQNAFISDIKKTRRAFEIVITKSDNLKYTDLNSLLYEYTDLLWMQQSSGIPGVYKFSLSKKQQDLLAKKIIKK